MIGKPLEFPCRVSCPGDGKRVLLPFHSKFLIHIRILNKYTHALLHLLVSSFCFGRILEETSVTVHFITVLSNNLSFKSQLGFLII